MDIEGLTVCVGKVYASYLEKSIPVWLDTLDSLTVVTKLDDEAALRVCEKHPKISLVMTDVFTLHGAILNKGAALNVGYANLDSLGCILHFDSDIHPKPDWRKLAEKEWVDGCLFGAPRYDESNKPITDPPPLPYGYFQLWNAMDPLLKSWPLFENWHPHCGAYDIEFQNHWGSRQRRMFNGVKLLHYGEPRSNWFGAGLSPEEQELSNRRMAEVHKLGLHISRYEARKPENRLKLPTPKHKLVISPKRGIPYAKQLLRVCMTAYPNDPFAVDARIEPHPIVGYTLLETCTSIEAMQRYFRCQK